MGTGANFIRGVLQIQRSVNGLQKSWRNRNERPCVSQSRCKIHEEIRQR